MGWDGMVGKVVTKLVSREGTAEEGSDVTI